MWRSRAQALLRSSVRRHPPIPTQVPPESLTLVPPLPLISSSRSAYINPRSLSSVTNPSFDFKEPPILSVSEAGVNGNDVIDENPDSVAEESRASSMDLAAGLGENQTPSWNFENGAKTGNAFTKNSSGDSLSSLWDETVSGDDPMGIFAPEGSTAAEPPNIEQVENVMSLLQSTLQEPLDESLDKMYLALSEEFVVQVIETPHVPTENLVGFVKWAFQYNESAKTSRVIELLVSAVDASANLSKKEAYVLWDLLKELGKEKGLLTTVIVNQMITMFWKLRKAKAGLEVFDKFPEFGCDPDGNTYYFTIQALRPRSMYDAAWSVCEKMLKLGVFPNGEKIGEIITFFCKGGKLKEAHLVYSKAMEKKVCPPRSCLDFLIGSLSQKGKTIHKALKLLDDYPEESLKYANKSFSTVVRGLCGIKDLQGAKKLLLRMADSGPPPGNVAFNYAITALSKEGDMEDALALLKVMESRGLRPDVYAYTVIMSGFAKGGLIEEAHNIFREAKKRHPKLTPVTYHILTRGYCKMEEFDKALECLKEMKDDGLRPNVDEYEKMIQSLCLKALDWRTAEKLLEEMNEIGLHLKGTTRSLIAAVKELAEEEVPPEGVEIEAA